MTWEQIVTPALIAAVVAALVAALTGMLSRRSALESRRQAQSEEVMRTLRWACDKAASTSERERRIGVGMLKALGDPRTLDGYDDDLRTMVDALVDRGLAAAIEAPPELDGDDEIIAEVGPRGDD